MDKEQVLEVKELIKYGFSLESIATGFKIPIEEVEKLKRQIEEERHIINTRGFSIKKESRWTRKK